MNAILYDSLQRIVCQHAPIPKQIMPAHYCAVKIGEGDREVGCLFDVSDEGDIENLIVDFEGVDILPILTCKQIDKIESACWKRVDEIRFDNDLDRGEERYNARMDAREYA